MGAKQTLDLSLLELQRRSNHLVRFRFGGGLVKVDSAEPTQLRGQLQAPFSHADPIVGHQEFCHRSTVVWVCGED